MKEDNLEILVKKDIESMIYEVRGKQVMLDIDVAKLYGYSTKRINETVSRNIKRFPESFCFQLTYTEYNSLQSKIEISKSEQERVLRSQIATSKKETRGGRQYFPYVFTEQGIAMLSGLLKNETAIQVSIDIMNAFVAMRKFITNNAHVFARITNLEYQQLKNKENFDKLFDSFQKDEQWKHKILFAGQFYDAHSILIDIIKEAKKNILIIDSYIDKTILDLLTKKAKNIEVEIITQHNKNINYDDITKFNKQYPSLKVRYSHSFHDRFIIIDNKTIYHIGASLKDLGNKCFGINKIEDEKLLEYIKNSTRFLPLSS